MCRSVERIAIATVSAPAALWEESVLARRAR
jgi:hypothetical protein